MTVVLLGASALAAATAAALLTRPPSTSGRVGRIHRRTRRPGLWLVGATAAVLGVMSPSLHARHLALAAVLGVAGTGVLRGVHRARQERDAHERRLRVVDYCEALLGELRAGQPLTRAVERSVEVWPEAEPVAAAARLDASVPAALRRLAHLPGASVVGRLAGAWEISAGTGSGLVLGVEQVLDTARADDAVARRVRAELSSARATARLVTALPLVVLVAAQGIGARPWHFLLDTAAGVGCLAAGVVLSLCGLRWIDHIAASAVDRPG